METSSAGAVIVCPSEETLRVGVQTNVKCGVPGCERVFAQMSARRFHMVKVHKIIETDQDAALEHHGAGGGVSGAREARDVRYYCPVAKCKYTPRLGRFFTSMKNLNQHYRHVHAEKKYKCSRCGHGFGELRSQVRHEKSCGLKFVCLQCSNIYNTKDALQTHCTRTGHRSGFSAINNIVFRDAVSGDNYVAAPVQENLVHPAERKTTPLSTSTEALSTTTTTTLYHHIPDTPQLSITDDSAKTTCQPSSAPAQALLAASAAPRSPQRSQLVTEQLVNTEPGLARPQHIADISELPHQELVAIHQSAAQETLSRPQQQMVETSKVPQQQLSVLQSGQLQHSSSSQSHHISASSEQQETLLSQQVQENSHQQLARKDSSQPQQGSAILDHHHPIPACSEQQEVETESPEVQEIFLQEVTSKQSTQAQQATAIVDYPSLPACSGKQNIPMSQQVLPQQSVLAEQPNDSLNQQHPSLPSLSVEQEIPAANHFTLEAQKSLSTPRKPSGPAFILPKPNALYMPVQVQSNRDNMIFGGQSGPVILIVNNAPPPEPPKRLKTLAPKVTRETGSQSRVRSVYNSRSEGAVGFAREMEVQTEESQRYQEVVETSSLSIQTMPCPTFLDMASSDLTTQKVAETQTMCHPQLAVETQSKSSQVSPNPKLKQTHCGSTRTGNKNSSARRSKQKRKEQTETGSQAGYSTHSADIAVTVPKKQRRRQKIGSSTLRDARNQSHEPSSLSIVEAIGTHAEYRSLPLLTQSEGILAGHRVSAAVGTRPELPQFESVGVGTMSTPLSLSDINITGQPIMVSVSTDMSRANTSVGTMPSPPLPESNSYSNHFTPVSMNTIGTDPLPGFSGSSKDFTLSSVFSQETQTSFWAEFQASIAESNATQTMESYLADTGINGDPLNMPSLMESGVQTCHAQNSQTQTWPTADTVSVGVGTSLLTQSHSPTLFEGMENDGLSRSIGIDTQLFDDLFPEVSSRSVAISTPLLDSMESSQQSAGMENVMFRPIGQSRSVGVSPLGHHDLSELDCLLRSTEGQTAASCQTTLSEGQYKCIATASVQTDTDFELPVFLTAASQTSTYDPSLTHMETQTVDMFSQLLSNMETQTSTDILADLNFANIETQTTMSPGAPTQALTSVETQTAPTSSAAVRDAGSVAGSRMSVYIDTETQTRLPNLHLTENSLTDSHTQTTVQQFASLVDELEKN